MKHVVVCLSAGEVRESSFHRRGSPVRLVKACLYAGKLDNAVLTSDQFLLSTCMPV